MTNANHIKIISVRLRRDVLNIFSRRSRLSIYFLNEQNKEKCLELRTVKNEEDIVRYLILPKRHFGTSVERNKFRRRVLEIFKKLPLPGGFDYAFVAYPSIKQFSFEELKLIIIKILRKQGFLQDV